MTSFSEWKSRWLTFIGPLLVAGTLRSTWYVFSHFVLITWRVAKVSPYYRWGHWGKVSLVIVRGHRVNKWQSWEAASLTANHWMACVSEEPDRSLWFWRGDPWTTGPEPLKGIQIAGPRPIESQCLEIWVWEYAIWLYLLSCPPLLTLLTTPGYHPIPHTKTLMQDGVKEPVA